MTTKYKNIHGILPYTNQTLDEFKENYNKIVSSIPEGSTDVEIQFYDDESVCITYKEPPTPEQIEKKRQKRIAGYLKKLKELNYDC